MSNLSGEATHVSVGSFSFMMAMIQLGLIPDPFGGGKDFNGYSNVCLVSSLRALGAEVPYTSSGPFRALNHGNLMLAPVGMFLIKKDFKDLTKGKFIKWTSGHFTGVIIAENVQEHDGEEVKVFNSVHDMDRPDQAVWYQLQSRREAVALTKDSSVTCAQALLAQNNKSRAAMKRRLIFEDTRCLIRPLPPIGWKQPLVPAVPATFDELPGLPEITFLALLNSHSRDSRIRFIPESRTYIIDGIPSKGSVTAVIHKFSNEFDAAAIIKKMSSGKNWPRPGYLAPSRFEAVKIALQSCPEGRHIAKLLDERPISEHSVCLRAKEASSHCASCATAIQDLAMTKFEIIEMWRLSGQTAANAGTWMHWCFEAWMNHVQLPFACPELQLLFEYVESLPGHTAYRTEWVIFAEDEWLAGSIDFVAELPDKSLVIFDWKRSKGLRHKYNNEFQSMRPPIQHLSDCQGIHYRLQLNIYRYILQRYYGKVVSGMKVVCTHPDNGLQAFVDEVPVMQDEVDAMMNEQRQIWMEFRRLSSNDFLIIDPLGGGLDDSEVEDLDALIEEESHLLVLEATSTHIANVKSEDLQMADQRCALQHQDATLQTLAHCADVSSN